MLIILFLVFLFSPSKILATVGGPTYISQIAYQSSTKSVYYLETDQSGRGCPPIIHLIDIAQNQDIELKTCDQVFQQFYEDNSENNQHKYDQYIDQIYQGLSYLGSVSLKKNNLKIKVDLISDQKFEAVVSQNGKTLSKIRFQGCSPDQPHLFEGYRIPNSDVMALLISNKADCFEGGYVKETLSIVKGVKYSDTNVVRSYKEASASEPNVGNQIIYANSTSFLESLKIKITNFFTQIFGFNPQSLIGR